MSRHDVIGWVKPKGMALRIGIGVTVALAIGLLSLAAVAPPTQAAEGCANEAIRAEQGAAALALPECRAYEMVTPPDDYPNLDESGVAVVGDGPGEVPAEASASGGSIAFDSLYSPSGSPSPGKMFESTRGTSGWSTKALYPPLGAKNGTLFCAGQMFFSANLDDQVLESVPQGCGDFEPPLAVGESRIAENLFVHAGEGAPYQLLNEAPEGIVPGRVIFQAASLNFSHVVFNENARLTPEAPEGNDLYEWNAGALRLVTYLPDGTPVHGTIAAAAAGVESFGSSPATRAHSLSSDGERVVFEAGGSLYLRENAGQSQSAIVPGSTQVDGEQCSEPARACTIQLDVSHGTGLNGSGAFQWASADGSRIFFTDEERLTTESTAQYHKPDLYEYSLSAGSLTDLTVDVSEPANVQDVAGASEDGSYLYFVANGVLTTKPNGRGATAVRLRSNLYMRHAGVTMYVATLSADDSRDWGIYDNARDISVLSSETSADGQFFAFNSIAPLTGYENAPAETKDCYGTSVHAASGEPCNEIFLYNTASGRLSCVSCSPTGSRPTGIAVLRSPSGTFSRRALSVDGSVFFDTPSPLLGQDTNGVPDVYEWSSEGVGACTEASATFAAESGGCLYPISSGTSSEPSYFVDASETGEDAYFITSQGLVAADTDNELSLYDARVNGGFQAGSDEAVQEPVCQSAEACKPPSSEPPAQLFAASTVLSGGGNLAAPPVPLTPSSPVAGGGVGKRGLSRAQKLAQALRACGKQPRRRQARCEAAAHRQYGGGRVVKGRESGKGGGR